VVCQNRWPTFSSAKMRGIAAATAEGSGTMNGLMTFARISASMTAKDGEQRGRRPSAPAASGRAGRRRLIACA
jgi:hypothetical protein